ncbi:MAG: AMMECR1 domain-containing protein, partial [Candidatus Bathyarchaeia archaeon]
MEFNLTDEEGEFLVRLARKAVRENLKNGKIISPPENVSPRLLEKKGVFVTINSVINEEKSLRGCIGFP